MSVEFVTRVHNFDGLVMIASCDNIIAGCYLAAARLDIPSMIVTGGSMQPGHHCGKAIVEADLDVARFSGAGEAYLDELEEAGMPFFRSMSVYGNSQYYADAGGSI